MFILVYTLCLVPVVSFALSWSFIILTGFFVKNYIQGIPEQWESIIIKNTEKSGAWIIKLGCVYISALLLGFGVKFDWVRWLLVCIVILFAMICIVRIGAGAEYSLKKLPKNMRVLITPMLLPDIISFVCCLFSGYWMIRTFFYIGM